MQTMTIQVPRTEKLVNIEKGTDENCIMLILVGSFLDYLSSCRLEMDGNLTHKTISLINAIQHSKIEVTGPMIVISGEITHIQQILPSLYKGSSK